MSKHRESGSSGVDMSAKKQVEKKPPQVSGLEHGYEFKELIGEGGMGQVWEAERDDGTPVVIKALLPELSLPGRERYRKRLIREGKALANIDSEHFPTFYEADAAGTLLVMVERLEGDDLSRELKRGSVSTLDALVIAAEVADGMHHAHKNGYVHRDLKPANIFVTNGLDKVKILDLGLVYLVSEKLLIGDKNRLTAPNTILGSVPYISPEQLKGSENVTGATDVYALGITIYRMLTGRVPFRAEPTPAGSKPDITSIRYEMISKILDINFTYPPLSELRPDLSKSLSDLVAQMTDRDPQKRPTMAEVRDGIKAFIEDFKSGTYIYRNSLVERGGRHDEEGDEFATTIALAA